MSSDSDSDSDVAYMSLNATPPRKAAEVWDSVAQTWTVLPSMAGRTAGSKTKTRRGKRGGRGGTVGKAAEARRKLLWVNGSSPVIGRNKVTVRPGPF